MNERETLPADVHPEAALLPWYANGTLREDERRQVDRHLESCPDCRRELDELAQLKHTLTDAYRAQSAPSVRLAQSVLSHVVQDAAGRGTGRISSGGWLDGLDAWFRALFQPRWIPTLAAMALAVQFGLLLWVTAPPGPSEEIATRSLGSPTATFRVTFREQATARQIHTLLDTVRGRIIDGPDPQGAYAVRVVAGDPVVRTKVLDTLRARADVVLRAEPLVP